MVKTNTSENAVGNDNTNQEKCSIDHCQSNTFFAVNVAVHSAQVTDLLHLTISACRACVPTFATYNEYPFFEF